MNWTNLYQPLRRKKPTVYEFDLDIDIRVDRALAVVALCQQHRFVWRIGDCAEMAEYLADGDLDWDMKHCLQRRIVNAADDEWEEWSIENSDTGGMLYEKMTEFVDEFWPLPNLILMASVRTQADADREIPALLRCPSVCRGVEIEPRERIEFAGRPGYLHPLLRYACPQCSTIGENRQRDRVCMACGAEGHEVDRIDWVRVTGGSEPMHPDHVRSIRDQCVNAGVPFSFLSWGEWHSGSDGLRDASWDTKIQKGVFPCGSPLDGFSAECGTHRLRDRCDCRPLAMYRVGHKKSGRTLDGRVWDQVPEVLKV